MGRECEADRFTYVSPASAAGIFNSNLKAGENKLSEGSPDQTAFEAALGHAVLDADELYAERERASLTALWEIFPTLELSI